MNLTESIYEARKVSVPLVFISTTDSTACIHKLRASRALKQFSEKSKEQEAPLITWDMERGLQPAEGSQAGVNYLAIAINATTIPQQATKGDAGNALRVIEALPPGCVVFFTLMFPDESLKNPRTVQQIWNLRDVLKDKPGILIFLGPDVHLPSALKHDVLQLDDPYPTLPELEEIVRKQHASMQEDYENLFTLTDDDATKAAVSLQGLAAFSAETAIAMTVKRDGINFREIREQRYKRIERQGMQVWRGTTRLSDLGGLEGAKQTLLRIVSSKKKRFGAIYYFEELNKMFSGANGGDLSGTADYFLAKTLTVMADYKIMGILLLGLPGTGKTELSQAIGNEVDMTTVGVDVGRMRDRMMGASEANIDDAYKSAIAFSGGNPIFIASCNSDDTLPTNLLRRFTERIYFDSPGRAAKNVIWKLKMTKYELPDQPLPLDYLWTGAEIESCCFKAWLSDITLIEAAKSVIPVAKTKPDELAELRRRANGAYISAATGMAFSLSEIEAEDAPPAPSKGRKVMSIQ